MKRRVRELRETSLTILSQGGIKDPTVIQELFRDHSDDLLYTETKRAAEEKSLMEQYEQIRGDMPTIAKRKDGSLVVTGL